jgi:nitric oxide reductase large subunit
MTTKKLWIGFITVMVLSFSVLLYFGKEIYKQAPPIPVNQHRQNFLLQRCTIQLLR